MFGKRDQDQRENWRCNLQSLGNTDWLLNRTATRPVAAQRIDVLGNPKLTARELVLPAVNGARLIPSWVILATVLLATTAICAAGVIRARAELKASSVQRQSIESEIQTLREANLSLQKDIQRLTRDPSTIELAARERLGMVKANDIVITSESMERSSSVNTVSFVR
jgi:cell division protein FtsB